MFKKIKTLIFVYGFLCFGGGVLLLFFAYNSELFLKSLYYYIVFFVWLGITSMIAKWLIIIKEESKEAVKRIKR